MLAQQVHQCPLWNINGHSKRYWKCSSLWCSCNSVSLELDYLILLSVQCTLCVYIRLTQWGWMDETCRRFYRFILIVGKINTVKTRDLVQTVPLHKYVTIVCLTKTRGTVVSVGTVNRLTIVCTQFYVYRIVCTCNCIFYITFSGTRKRRGR